MKKVLKHLWLLNFIIRYLENKIKKNSKKWKHTHIFLKLFNENKNYTFHFYNCTLHFWKLFIDSIFSFTKWKYLSSYKRVFTSAFVSKRLKHLSFSKSLRLINSKKLPTHFSQGKARIWKEIWSLKGYTCLWTWIYTKITFVELPK